MIGAPTTYRRHYENPKFGIYLFLESTTFDLPVFFFFFRLLGSNFFVLFSKPPLFPFLLLFSPFPFILSSSCKRWFFNLLSTRPINTKTKMIPTRVLMSAAVCYWLIPWLLAGTKGLVSKNRILTFFFRSPRPLGRTMSLLRPTLSVSLDSHDIFFQTSLDLEPLEFIFLAQILTCCFKVAAMGFALFAAGYTVFGKFSRDTTLRLSRQGKPAPADH